MPYSPFDYTGHTGHNYYGIPFTGNYGPGRGGSYTGPQPDSHMTVLAPGHPDFSRFGQNPNVNPMVARYLATANNNRSPLQLHPTGAGYNNPGVNALSYQGGGNIADYLNHLAGADHSANSGFRGFGNLPVLTPGMVMGGGGFNTAFTRAQA